ncbi:hypothetical protein SDC9_122822 [bioreactor metagenome]|uniref:Uncharacterized protein n=1 Tax=bioreactor metagenome TaxID=1076179 RepID=A0A645CG12_9ZZZZ
MIHGSRSREQRICADGLRRALREGSGHHAVVIGARRGRHHFLEQRMVRVCQLVQSRRGNDIEHGFPHAERADAEHGENQRCRHHQASIDERTAPLVFQNHAAGNHNCRARDAAEHARGNQRAALLLAFRR